MDGQHYIKNYTKKEPVFWAHVKLNLPKVYRNEKYLDENVFKITK